MTAQRIREYTESIPDFEGTRAGKRFHIGNNAAVTGIAPVTSLPTTAAQWGIYNASTTKSMFLTEIGAFLTSGTPGVGGVLLACLYTTGTTISANKSGVAVSRRNNGALNSASSQPSAALCNSGITISSPAAPIWYPVADRNADASVTAFAASATFRSPPYLNGRWVIPPLGNLGLAVVSPAGTNPLWAPFLEWLELEVENA